MSKTVKFRRESLSGGSLYEHQRSDSGVGSFSDSESRTAYTASTGSDYDSQYRSLQQAYDRECNAKDQWKQKATDLGVQLNKANKDLKEAEARLRALEDRVETLGEERTSLAKSNKDLSEENARLKEDLKEFKKAARRKSSSPPVVNGGPVLTDSEDKKPRRSSSKRHSISERVEREREREREKISKDMEIEMEKEKERDRLRKRFEKDTRGEESDAKSSNTSNRSHRSRRDSYVEPLGPPASRPQPSSPSRGFAYTSAQQPQQPPPPQFISQREANTPRVVHPKVTVSYSEDVYDEEDGNYHLYPLPKQQRSIERRDRRS